MSRGTRGIGEVASTLGFAIQPGPAREVLPSLRLQLAQDPASREYDPVLAYYLPDLRDRDPCNFSRDSLPWGRGEEKLIVIAAMQRESQVHRAPLPARDRPWNCFRLNLRPYLRFFAQVRQVSGKAIADINHRGGYAALPQAAADCNAWQGLKMLGIIRHPRLAS